MQRSAIEGATSRLGCTDSEAVILLRHYRWNLDGLMGAIVSQLLGRTMRLLCRPSLNRFWQLMPLVPDILFACS
jgi:hypothetical protein